MAQTTEAACLLQSGTSYADRIGFRRPGGGDIFAGIKSGGVSLYFDDEPIYHFDLDGRWQRAFVEGVHYLKGLDPTVRAVGRGREGSSLVLRRRTLDDAEAVALDASVRGIALGLIADLDADRLEALPPPPGPARPIAPGDLREFLGRVAGWDGPAWASYRDRYRAAFPVPPPFVPPDCPNALVLLASPRDGDHERHAREVADLAGARLAQCRDVFLAGSEALRRPVDAILADLAAIARVFPIEPEKGQFRAIHAHVDDLAPPLPDSDGWRMLRRAHLGRVSIGLDPGAVDRPGLARAVADLKAAEVGVGVVIPVDPGGRSGLGAVPTLVAGLPLGAGDLITLVAAESHDLAAELKAQIAAALPSKGARVIVYNPDKRWT